MLARAGGFGCGCDSDIDADAYAAARARIDGGGYGGGFGGIFSTLIDVGGSFIGDPGLGDQLASKAQRAYAPITQNPSQIAAQVLPSVQASITSGAPLPDPAKLSAQSVQIGGSIAADVAAALKVQGIMLPAGTVGAELQKPSLLDAFGGRNSEWVLIGGLALGALLVFKEF